MSVATVVREAIDRGLTNSDTLREEAGKRLLDAPDMPAPEPRELRGVAEDIDESGALLLRAGGRLERILSGDVEQLRA